MNKSPQLIRFLAGALALCCATLGWCGIWEPAQVLYESPGNILQTSALNARGIVSAAPDQIYAAYTQTTDPNHSQLAVEQSEDNGVTWTRFKPNQTLNPTLCPGLAPSSRSNSVHISWLEETATGVDQGYVWYQHWPDPAIRLSGPDDADATTPCVEASNTGTVIVLWTRTQMPPYHRPVVYRRSTDNGVTWSDLQVLADPGTEECNSPASVAFGGNSSAHVVWSTYFLGRVKLWYCRSTDFGATWQSPSVLGEGPSSELAANEYGPSVSAASERADIVWTYAPPTYDYVLYALTSSNRGESWPLQPLAIKQTAAQISNATVTTGARTLAYVAWQEMTSGSSVYYSRSPGVDLPWGEDTCLLTGTAVSHQSPRISVDDPSILHLVCIKTGQGNAFVYKGAMQFLSNSSAATGFSEQGHIVRDVVFGGGTTFVIYQDGPGIYYSRSDDAGLHWLVPEFVAVGETPSLAVGYWLEPPSRRPVVAFLLNGSISAAVRLGPNFWQLVSIEQCNPPYTVAGPPCLTTYVIGSDEFFVVYQYQVRTDQTVPPNYFIRCAEFTGYGVQWTFDVASTGTEVCRDPAMTNICLYPDFFNNLHVVWEHNGEIDYRTRTNDVWENAVPISANYPPPVTEPGSHPSITVDGDANMLYAAWRGPDNNGNLPGDIWRRPKDLGQGIWPVPVNQSQTAGQESDYPTMASSFITTWQEQVGGTWNLWAKSMYDEQGGPYVSSQVNLTFPQTTAATEVVPGQGQYLFSNSVWTQAVRTNADPVFEVGYLRKKYVPSSGGGGQTAGRSTVAERKNLWASPNPCHGTGTIAFALHEPSDVTLAVYDLSGRTVRTLLKDKVLGGNQRICWDGRDEAGKVLPQGTYLCRLSAGRTSTTAVIQLLR